MISCEQCKCWQHAVCFAILSEDDAPDTHLCEECAKVIVIHLSVQCRLEL